MSPSGRCFEAVDETLSYLYGLLGQTRSSIGPWSALHPSNIRGQPMLIAEWILVLHHSVPVHTGVERHLVVDSNLNVIILVANQRGSWKLSIDSDHFPLLAIWCTNNPCQNPIVFDQGSKYATGGAAQEKDIKTRPQEHFRWRLSYTGSSERSVV